MNPLDIHDEWLSLIEVSGPFLATPVLKRIFSTGLPAVEPRIRQYLRQAYDEWCEARDNDDPRFPELHRAWIHEVLARGLEYDHTDSGELLLRGERIPSEQSVTLPEHGVTLAPDYALVSSGKSQLLVQIYSAGTDLQAALKLDGWSASPAERMERLCRTSGCRLGLVTDGERWMLVDAPIGAVSTFASWYARLWGQERLTLQAFLTLLGIRRFFGPDDETLPSMLDESLQHQEEVTDALGEQVRRAVEVLIQALGKEDRERSGALLQGVEPTELYEAGLTIMMRLVFLLSAEERGLLLMGEEAYESNYAISTLRMQLRQETEEVLERRNDAWSRLLATFRAVYGGIEHEMLRLPALGGSLFDPDRFPFLEGRAKGSCWRDDSARPLPIDNRTVVLLLEAIQQYEGRTLSYRALDVEQIGYVYEGLLERTVRRTERVTVELTGGKGAKKTLYGLDDLEALRRQGDEVLVNKLSGTDAIKRGAGAIRKDLDRPVDAAKANRLLTACAGDEELRNRALPFLNLLRTDPWGYPLIYPEGAFIVTTGSDRRETGTHYTPKSLTESIVETTLEPITYIGPADNLPRQQWILKSAEELLDLKICDPAMGSGAFLVQVCRWLAERIVDSWAAEENAGRRITSEGIAVDDLEARDGLLADPGDRLLIARRLVAERCLYGVDLNPLAVELAKLSIWLVTLAKGRPFGFLDHNLKCGDSLLGIHRLDQLTELSVVPGGKGQQWLFGQNMLQAVHEAMELRQRLRDMPIRDIFDVQAMEQLNTDARDQLKLPELIANAFICEVFANNSNDVFKSNIASLKVLADQAAAGDQGAIHSLIKRSISEFSVDPIEGQAISRAFHWPLEFPEVFSGDKNGFDAVCGNPPFVGGKKITAAFGVTYRSYLVRVIASGVKGNADLVAYFFLRAGQLLARKGFLGLLSTNTISQGDTRKVGLDKLVDRGFTIPAAVSSAPWPGKAAVEISQVFMCRDYWSGAFRLDGVTVPGITSQLTSLGRTQSAPYRLNINKNKSFIGSLVVGIGFVISQEEARELILRSSRNSECLLPYLNGEDINSRADSSPSRWIINFFDWPLSRNAEGSWSTAGEKQRKVWVSEGRVPNDYPHSVAEDYPDLLAIVDQRVRPGREKLGEKNDSSAKGYAKYWWRYGRMAKDLYEAIPKLSRFLVHPFTSKYHSLVFCRSGMVFSHMTVVIAVDNWSEYCVLQSELHWKWTLKYGNKLETRPQYSPTDCFETFPFPAGSEGLEFIGERYYRVRQGILSEYGEGLTKMYNKFHDPSDNSLGIVELRKIQCEMDRAVAGAYGWSDISLDHGFHRTSLGLRFTISEAASSEVLERLLELNHDFYGGEVSQGGREVCGSKGSKFKSNSGVGSKVQRALDFNEPLLSRQDET